jgi:lycopene cyclase domain-containing protein
MAYTVAAAGAAVAVVGFDAYVVRTNLLRRKVFWASYAIVLAFQLIVNGILTGVPIVLYNPDVIIGGRFAYAPVEDILFGFALVTATLSMWVWLGRRGVER